MSLKNAFDDIMSGMDKDLDLYTVYREPLPHNNRRFGTQYWCRDYNTLKATASAARDNVDPYRSPFMSNIVKQSDGYWHCDVHWYSLD